MTKGTLTITKAAITPGPSTSEPTENGSDKGCKGSVGGSLLALLTLGGALLLKKRK